MGTACAQVKRLLIIIPLKLIAEPTFAHSIQFNAILCLSFIVIVESRWARQFRVEFQICGAVEKSAKRLKVFLMESNFRNCSILILKNRWNAIECNNSRNKSYMKTYQIDLMEIGRWAKSISQVSDLILHWNLCVCKF